MLARRSVRVATFLIVAILAEGCGAAALSSFDSVTAPPSRIELNHKPEIRACDTVGMDYNTMTFRIDPAAAEQVTAVNEHGTTLLTYWPLGFTGGTAEELVVYDSAGEIVVTDGEVLVAPELDWPRLHGYMVCQTPTSLYIFADEPS